MHRVPALKVDLLGSASPAASPTPSNACLCQTPRLTMPRSLRAWFRLGVSSLCT